MTNIVFLTSSRPIQANSSHQALEGTVSLTTELSLTLLSPTGRWAESVQVGVSSFNLQLQAGTSHNYILALMCL